MSKNKIIKAGLGYTIGNYLLKGLSFLTIPIFARILSTSDYGVINTFGAYESILFVIIGFSIHSSFKNARYKYGTVQEGSQKGNDYRTYVSNAFILICISGTAWFLIAGLFNKSLAALLKLDGPMLFLLVINSAASAVITAYNSDVSINYEYKKYLAIAGFNSIGNVVLSLVLIYYVFPEKRDFARILGMVAPIAIAALFVIIQQVRADKPNHLGRMMKWGLKYSLPIVPHGLSQIVLSSFDRIMITNMINTHTTGIYSFSYNIFMIIQVVASSVDTIWTPWFYENRKKEDFDQINRVSKLYIYFLCSMCLCVMLVSPEIVYILGGLKYQDAVYCVPPVLAGGFFTYLYNIPVVVEYYYGKTKHIAAATTLAAVMNIVLNYIFIRRYGYVAAAYTTLVTYILYFLFHYLMALKIEKKRLFVNKSFIICSLCVVSGLIVSLLCINMILLRIILAVIIAACFVLLEEKRYGIIKDLILKRFKTE